MATNNSDASKDLEVAARNRLASLDVRRKALETESAAIVSELTAPVEGGGKPMGIDTPLVDPEGYPRADIDIYRARTLRHRLAQIRTDHKALMREIEQGLATLAIIVRPEKAQETKKELEARKAPKPKPRYDAATGKWVVQNWDGSVAGVENGDQLSFEHLSIDRRPPRREIPSSALDSTSMDGQSSTSLVPFARVNAVAVRSPADVAGMKEGDLILQFGHILDAAAFATIAELVPRVASTNGTIAIRLLRGDQENPIAIELRPQPWEGRGLLGCHIVPYTP